MPLLTLGIPGDATTAMMIGGFMIHGLFRAFAVEDNPELVYTIFAASSLGQLLWLSWVSSNEIFINVLSIKSYYFPLS